jgi:multisubunit Na+/H+ antiporter MnhB subunit
MTVIVKKVAQIIAGIIFLFGIYIIMHGHITPGGGFTGGVIIAGAFIFLIVGYGDTIEKLKNKRDFAIVLGGIAILLFIFLSASGLLLETPVFFKNYSPFGSSGNNGAGLIPVYDIIIGIEVATALFSIFLTLVIFKENKIK